MDLRVEVIPVGQSLFEFYVSNEEKFHKKSIGAVKLLKGKYIRIHQFDTLYKTFKKSVFPNPLQ